MRIGLMGLNMGAAGEDPAVARDLGVLAEELGYDSLWVADHPLLPVPPPPGSPFPAGYAFGAPLMVLAHLAGHTSRVQLATGVLLIPQRHPVHLAKELATLDRMSGGRAVLGVGVGYIEHEFGALGVPMASRGRRADEYLAAMRELWTSERPSFHGEFVAFDDIESRPLPVRAGGPPLVVGGHSDAALARAARLGDGWLGWHMRPEQAARKAARLAGLARPADRGPLEISVMPPERLSPELVVAYADAGVDRIIVTPAPGLDPARLEAFVRRNGPGELGAV